MTKGKIEIVIDTNVAVVANGEHQKASSNCKRNCIDRLLHIQKNCLVLLDDRHLILNEYRRNLRLSGQPGLGDAFYKWLHDNQANPEFCRTVRIRPHRVREFEDFPSDPLLSSFDPDDRKFVAVALASGTGPHVLNASDTDWWQYRQELERHGVNVVFICPELMQA